MMWASDQGDLTIAGPGYANVEPSDSTDGANAGILKYYGQDGTNSCCLLYTSDAADE